MQVCLKLCFVIDGFPFIRDCCDVYIMYRFANKYSRVLLNNLHNFPSLKTNMYFLHSVEILVRHSKINPTHYSHYIYILNFVVEARQKYCSPLYLERSYYWNYI